MSLKMDILQKLFYSVFETHFYIFLKKGFKKRGSGMLEKNEDKEEKGN